ncbi:SNF1-related protein kinase regulatory subunit gamma-1-like [Rhynchospora pubera]|uniref:SNF1-related protein kinase regulatory subunit gamma-1-like n=1 Tax=Rhynchospora pubera TaxID=906938 RepID=A0AAV8GPM9_9POAL|nr:SNF1-related protein kinase regulatory subunit gamma-1-like [Rhynchospora pubera]
MLTWRLFSYCLIFHLRSVLVRPLALSPTADDIVVDDAQPIAAGILGDEFVAGLLNREAFGSIMYSLRSVPVVESNGTHLQNFVTQMAIVRGLLDCKGRDWFDYMYNFLSPIFGLPFISCDQVKYINSDDFLLETFQLIRDNYITGSLIVRAVCFLFIRPDLFSDFRKMRVREFMDAVGTTIPDFGPDAPSLTCEPNDSLGSIIENIASRYVHRI